MLTTTTPTAFDRFLAARVDCFDHHLGQPFYVFPDALQNREHPAPPAGLDDAYGNGFLCMISWGTECSLQLENQSYHGPLNKLARVLFDWATSEGYQW